MASPKDYVSSLDSVNQHQYGNYPTLSYSYAYGGQTNGYYGCDGDSNFQHAWGHVRNPADPDHAPLQETWGGLGGEGTYYPLLEGEMAGGGGGVANYYETSYYDWSSPWSYLARTMDAGSHWGSAASSWLVAGTTCCPGSSDDLSPAGQYNASVLRQFSVKQEAATDDYCPDYVAVKLHDNLASTALRAPSTFTCQVRSLHLSG